MTDGPERPPVRRFTGGAFGWERVPVLSYKEEGAAPFRAITRRILFGGPGLSSQLRYFEVAPGGHSTLERHEHEHGVLVLRGTGRCLVGAAVYELGSLDLVEVPAHTWHQFRAGDTEPLGFLCMVDAARDKPILPGPDDLAALRGDPRIAEFIRA